MFIKTSLLVFYVKMRNIVFNSQFIEASTVERVVIGRNKRVNKFAKCGQGSIPVEA